MTTPTTTQPAAPEFPLDGKVPARRIDTVAAVREFFDDLVAAGINFHPDDSLAEQVELATGKPTFSHDEAIRLNRIMQQAWDVCGEAGADIYGIAMNAMRVALPASAVRG